MTEETWAAGWYVWPHDSSVERYYDGTAWTEQERPYLRQCEYCTNEIPGMATRCPRCAGEFYSCPTDGLVAVREKQKNVGVLRGGTQIQRRCVRCGRVVDGPRW